MKLEYVVTDFGAVSDDTSNDLSVAFEKIFKDIQNASNRGNNGATIVIPHGNFYLYKPIKIEHNFITIGGLNYGWRSVVDSGNPGGSRVVVKNPITAFSVPGHLPRITGLCFRDFIIDGLDSANQKVGIHVERDNDGIQILNMVCMRLHYGVELRNADAAFISGNQLVECRNCLYLTNAGKSNLISNNRMGGGKDGITCFVEGQSWLNIIGNNIFPDGYSNLVMKRCGNCLVTGNHIKSYYVGALYLEEAWSNSGNFEGNNLITIVGNHIMAVSTDDGRWNNNPHGWDKLFGVVQLNGNDIQFTGNTVYTHAPKGSSVILVRRGARNYLSDCKIYSDRGCKKFCVIPNL